MTKSKITVLVVDDSVVIRRLVTNALSIDPDIEVVGTASSGRLALQKIAQLKPDVVTLDVEMPDMNGLEALVELRKTHQRLPVIMFSAVTERGASATLDALTKGANDYVTKPSAAGSADEAMANVRRQLIPKIKALAEWAAAGGRARTRPATGGAPTAAPTARAAKAVAPRTPVAPIARLAVHAPIDAVAIGVSTGGPDALSVVLPRLPADLRVPIFVVQHMPPVFTRLFAERLSAKCALTVSEARHGDLVRPGCVYVAPGDFHMTVVRQGPDVRIAINQDEPEAWCRPAVNVLFRSVASVYAGGTLAVVLTGMGQDGLRGVEMLYAKGAQIVVQDEESSIVWGMPGAIATAGLADQIVPLSGVAAEITGRVAAGRSGAPARPAKAGVAVR
ncbi:MAG: chemotaxis response regulator protein-glutamate methylesterase [Actinomycetota bacterium]